MLEADSNSLLDSSKSSNTSSSSVISQNTKNLGIVNTTEIKKFIGLANRAGLPVRLQDFQKDLTPGLVQNSLIAVLLHFHLLDPKKYPNGALQVSKTGFDGPMLARGFGDRNFWDYDASVDELHKDIQRIFPSDCFEDYAILIMPHRVTEKVSAAFNYVAEACEFIERTTPILEPIADEVTKEVLEHHKAEGKFRELQSKISEAIKRKASLRLQIAEVQKLSLQSDKQNLSCDKDSQTTNIG